MNTASGIRVLLLLVPVIARGQSSPPDVAAILAGARAAPSQVILSQDFEGAPVTLPECYAGTVVHTVDFSGITTEQAVGGTHSYKIQVTFQAGRWGSAYFRLPAQIPVWDNISLKMYIKAQAPTNTWFFHGLTWGDLEVPVTGNVLQGRKTGTQGDWEVWEATARNGGGAGQYAEGPVIMFQLPDNSPATSVTFYIDNITMTGHIQSDWPSIWSQVSSYYTVTVEQSMRAAAGRRLGDMDSWKADCEARYGQLVAPSGPGLLTSQYQGLRTKIRGDLDTVPAMLDGIRAALADPGTPFNADLNSPERVLMLDKYYLDLAGAYAGYAQQYSGSDFITFALDLTGSYAILPTGPTGHNDEQSYYGWGGATGGLENPQILPDTSPVPAKPSRSLSAFGCRGTIVPLSLAIRAGGDLPGLTFAASDLRCGSSTIMASAIDLRVVGCWYRPFGRSPRLTNELLLHDPDFAKGNPATQTNLYKDALYGNDVATLQPLTIVAGQNRQFYATIKIPEMAAAGVYQGQITATTSNSKSMTWTVTLEVLPFDLEPTPYAYSFFYTSYLVSDAFKVTDGINSWYKNAGQMEAELRNMADHGVNTLNLYDGTPVKTDGLWDFSTLNTRLDIAKRSGLTRGPFTWLGHGLQFMPDSRSGYLHTWLEVLTAISDLVPAVNTFCQSRGYPRPAFYGADEASGEPLMQLTKGYNAVNQVGGILTTACYPNYFSEIGATLSLPIVLGGASNLIGQRSIQASKAAGRECWIYNCPATCNAASPSVYRRRYGLAMWRNGEQGAAPWEFCGMPQARTTGQGYNGLSYTEPLYAVAYPTWNGKPIDTIIYEAWREGIYDTRYLTTLQRHLAEAKAAGVRPILTAEVDSWLASLSVNDDLQTVRSQMADYTKRLLLNNVSGTVNLDSFGGPISGAPMAVRLTRDGTILRSDNVTLDNAGRFILTDVLTGTYDVQVKASHWLARTKINQSVAGDTILSSSFDLVNGDADGDNAISSTDVAIVLAEMDTGNPQSDLDGDGVVNSSDLSIVLGGLDLMGD